MRPKRGSWSVSAKGAKYFREDSISAEGGCALLDIKDVDEDHEFEMLVLDG